MLTNLNPVEQIIISPFDFKTRAVCVLSYQMLSIVTVLLTEGMMQRGGEFTPAQTVLKPIAGIKIKMSAYFPENTPELSLLTKYCVCRHKLYMEHFQLNI